MEFADQNGNFEQKIVHFFGTNFFLRVQNERRSLMARARARAALPILSESASGALNFGQERERELPKSRERAIVWQFIVSMRAMRATVIFDRDCVFSLCNQLTYIKKCKL